MFLLYLSISCVSSWSFPAALSVVPNAYGDVVSSTIFDDAPVAYLTPPSWCTAEGTVLVDPGGDRSGMVWLCAVIAWWVLGKVQPDETHLSPGRTRGRWVHRGTLPPIWPLSSCYEDIRPGMPCWHQLFHPKLGDSWRAGASSFPYRSKITAHCPDHMSSLSSIPGTRGFRIGVVLLLDWLPTEAAEPSLLKDVWLFRRSHFLFTRASGASEATRPHDNS